MIKYSNNTIKNIKYQNNDVYQVNYSQNNGTKCVYFDGSIDHNQKCKSVHPCKKSIIPDSFDTSNTFSGYIRAINVVFYKFQGTRQVTIQGKNANTGSFVMHIYADGATNHLRIDLWPGTSNPYIYAADKITRDQNKYALFRVYDEIVNNQPYLTVVVRQADSFDALYSNNSNDYVEQRLQYPKNGISLEKQTHNLTATKITGRGVVSKAFEDGCSYLITTEE